MIEWNPAAERKSGSSRLQGLGQPLSLLIVPPRYREAHERGMNRYVATRVPHLVNHRVQLEAQRRGGEVFPCEIVFHPLEFEDRMYFAAYLRELTEQRRGDRERDQLARVAEASTDFIAFSGLDNRLLYINGRAADCSAMKATCPRRRASLTWGIRRTVSGWCRRSGHR